MFRCITLSMLFLSFSMSAAGIYGQLYDVDKLGYISVKDENGIATIKIQDVDFGENLGADCDDESIEPLCDFIENELSGIVIGLVVSSGQDSNLVGDVVYNNKILSVELVRQGKFKFDAQQTRSMYMINSEREAMCNYRGIWAEYLNFETAKKCQSLADF